MGNNTGQRVVVIGGGIAGASAAFALADHPSKPTVVLAEAEAQLAHHTTGRSAAQLILNYGADPVRPLTSASLGFLNDPPADYCDGPLLTPQSVITVGTNDQDEVLDAALASGAAVNPEVREIPIDEAAERFPPLRPDRFDRAILEDGSFDIDVAGLHQCFVRGFRDRGGRIAVLTRIDAAAPRSGGGWTLSTTDGPLVADLVVNAAGAWGDVVAAAAGVAPVGLVPKRRTAFMVTSRWPESPS
ncbi:MAG: FAD-binding oxidoreductase, partial [Actinomycetota bacterium]